MSYWNNNEKSIRISTDNIIEHIPTSDLQKELDSRLEIKESKPEDFDKIEKLFRHRNVEVVIDLRDYNLIDKEDVTPDFFSDEDLIYYLETHKNYAVFHKGAVGTSDADSVCTYLTDLPKWKLKEFLCDTFGLNHFATTEDIINEIKQKLN